jgi:hypothetical protein
VTSTIETAAETQPFHLEIPEEKLDDLRRRIAAAWEEPDLFSQEIRAAFQPLRSTNGA